MIFIAADTPRVINLLSDALVQSSIKLVSFAQVYLEKSIALQTKFKSDETCYENNRDQFMDMMLLSGCDVVIAGQYSSFTQSMPVTLALGNPDPSKNRRFCEVGRDSDMMQCTRDFKEWLEMHFKGYRQNANSTIETIGNGTGFKHHFENHQQWPLVMDRTMMESIVKDTVLVECI